MGLLDGLVDLRSDTVTRPSPEMRRAMAEAEVGDDVYGEDPTVRALEETGAALVGQEAALFVPSGTMGNQVAVLTHTQRGDEVFCEAESHIYYYEVGDIAALAGAQPRPIPGSRGRFTAADLRRAVREPNIHFPRPRLVCLENTHNRAGGTVWRPEEVDAVVAAAHELGLVVHLDGARLFNAAVALGVPAERLARGVDSVMFCLSKGLGAPVGSLLCGPADWIERARKERKRLGGGMRQAGILAAAGLYALRHNVERLAEDHANARWLAGQLARIEGLRVDPGSVETNMVLVGVPGPAAAFSQALKERGVLANPSGPETLRLVTHLDVDRAGCERAVEAFRSVTRELAA
ncbi:MAG: low-specificity L-threonine aldolase [Bacillota bacterium]|nr:low-specificity L-threonine aldolase [Bacillota bacterium]